VALRGILVGTGGHGAYWCRAYLPPVLRQGLVDIVAAVDIDPTAHIHAKEGLGLADDRCYTDLERAFAEHEADFCAIVVPPAFHERVVDLALRYGMDILSEKPIADTLEASVRIARKVKAAGAKMGVTMTHRFDQDKTSLRHALRSGAYGALDYLTCHYSGRYREYGSARAYRHEMEHPLLIEMAVHHLDILADLAGGVCETIYAETWNAPWSTFKGDAQGFVVMNMRGGVRAVYEGANTNAHGLNDWANEYIRAECENGTIVLDHRRIDVRDGTGGAQPLALLDRPSWGNVWLIEQFVEWVRGGAPMETEVASNLQSMAMVFAAIESSRTKRPVQVQELLANAMRTEGDA